MTKVSLNLIQLNFRMNQRCQFPLWTVYLFSHSCQPEDGLLCHNMFCCWCAVSQLLCAAVTQNQSRSLIRLPADQCWLCTLAVHGTGVCEESCLHSSLSDDLHRHVVPIRISCSNHVVGSVSGYGNARIVVCLFPEGNLYHIWVGNSMYSVCLLWIFLFYSLTQNFICIFSFWKCT